MPIQEDVIVNYIISDIHGAFNEFKQMLEKIEYNPDSDTMIVAGDVIDRGNDSIDKVTGATGYVVYRKTAKGSWSRIANIKSGSTTSYTDTKASKGVTYTYTVRAYNGSTMSSFNSTKSAKR